MSRVRCGARVLLIWPLGLGLLVAACGGSSGAPRAAEHVANGGKELAAFDADGRSSVCETPREECAEPKANPDFADRCRLQGFRILRCGCDDLCSGKVETNEKFYDASGNERSCSPVEDACAPAETSAKFQDACTDARHKLVVCGCEWLCNGPLAKGVSGASE